MFDWISDLVEGIGNGISTSLSNTWQNISDSVWSKFLSWLYNLIYSGLSEFFSVMTGMGAELFNLAWVQAALKFFSLFGWGLFVAGLVVAIFDIAIEYQSQGSMNVKRQVLPFVWGLLAVNLFTTVPVALFKFSVSLQNIFAKDLIGVAMGTSVDVANAAQKSLVLFTPGATAVQSPLLSLLGIICVGYCIIKCFFSNIKRGGILLTQIAVGSLYMFSLPRGYGEGFTSWCKQVVALCFTAFMQTTLLLMGLLTLHTNVLLGLGVMLAANEVPRIAQQFGMETGTKANIMSVVHTTTSAVNLTRAIVRK